MRGRLCRWLLLCFSVWNSLSAPFLTSRQGGCGSWGDVTSMTKALDAAVRSLQHSQVAARLGALQSRNCRGLGCILQAPGAALQCFWAQNMQGKGRRLSPPSLLQSPSVPSPACNLARWMKCFRSVITSASGRFASPVCLSPFGPVTQPFGRGEEGEGGGNHLFANHLSQAMKSRRLRAS